MIDRKKLVRRVIIILSVLLLICVSYFAVVYGSMIFFMRKAYGDDIIVNVPDTEDVIIIREWNFMLGSGAEIYYKKPDLPEIEIGTTTGGDDGYCPFNDGQYSYVIHKDSIYIRWRISFSNNTTNWRAKTFEFPD